MWSKLLASRLPDFAPTAMFPLPWNSRAWMGNTSNAPDQMWNSMWNPSTTAPPTSSYSWAILRRGSQLHQPAQSQAQTQAQINALQQQNALLNQQLASQSISHIQHLQQLIPQQSPPQQTPPPQVPVQPEPSSPQSQSAVPTPTPPTFNSEEMLEKMRLSFQADLEEALKRPKESQQPPPTTPPVRTPPALPQPLTLPSVLQPSNTPGPCQLPRRSRSPVPTREHHRDDKRTISIPRSPPRRRARSTDSRRRRQRSSRPHRESSLTLRSVSPDQRSPSYDFFHNDPPRHSGATKLSARQPQSYEQGYTHNRQGWSSSHQDVFPTGSPFWPRSFPGLGEMGQVGTSRLTTNHQTQSDMVGLIHSPCTRHRQQTTSCCSSFSSTKVLPYQTSYCLFTSPTFPLLKTCSFKQEEKTLQKSVAGQAQVTPAFIQGINPIARGPHPSHFYG